MGPAITVVVPLYNSRGTLRRCLDSIVRQTFENFEVVVVDDGSTDGGAEIAREMADPRIRVASQENRGRGGARNRGIREARAPLVAFLDADDEWEPGFLAAVMDLRSRYPEAGMYITGIRRLSDADGSCLDVSFVLPGGAVSGLTERFFSAPEEGWSIASGSSSALPKQVIEEAGMFAEDEPMGQDVDMWVRVAVKHPIAGDGRVLAIYHLDGNPERERKRARMKKPYPPALRRLRALLAAGAVPEPKVAEVQHYVDYLAMEHVYWQLELGFETAGELVRTERFYTARFRFEAALLRAGARVLPLRAVSLLRWFPPRVWNKVRRILRPRPVRVVGRLTIKQWRTG